ncbi:MAG TPA: hypothetical protein VMY42_09930 [Thermoguttaceae bacterium]|nr:hypothetical protein [Thermoguttaceae bacterium]
MTPIPDITERFRVHAQGTEAADNPKNLADYIWMLRHHSVSFGPEEIWPELLQGFEDLNSVLKAEPEAGFARPLVYAINGLLMLCLESAASQQYEEEIRGQIRKLGWRICVAWDAVLAGDIDSIGDHVELEETVA